jgi:DNA invertase Pin-like site-specific DNA recombinase
MKVAIYARYSSENQREASIADQFRICREFARRQGWTIAKEYSDAAVSGATLLRSGFQAMMASALRKEVDVVLAESLDRFSRDQEDTAGLFKRLSRSTCSPASPSAASAAPGLSSTRVTTSDASALATAAPARTS